MDDFILKDVVSDIDKELEQIGFDKTYLQNAVEKFKFKNIKIFGLSIPQANILKQTALSYGADCAIHRETITAKIDKTDCLLGGSYSQLRKISKKLRSQPFKLAKLADLIESRLSFNLKPLLIKQSTFDFSRPYIVGVVNITRNSFSDGGSFFEYDDAVAHLKTLIEDGADIIELGAESTKPFSSGVSDEEQLSKLLPILKFIKDNDIKTPVSIDTRSANVALKCIEAGADVINDVSGFEFDAGMAKTLADLNVPVIIQHTKGTPDNMQINPSYDYLIDDIFLKLKEKINIALASGVKQENIIIDVGIGFGKTKEQNFVLINRLEEFKSLNCPLMLGVSRKSLLGMPEAANDEKDIFTLALNASVLNQVNFLRVHNVGLHKKLLQIKF